jgi:hypothetical protein
MFFNKMRLIIFVLVLAIIGTVYILISHAASPFASTNADVGTLTCGASIVSDSTASDGRKVEFSSCATQGPTYYVNCSSGSDDNNGTSSTSAWKTIAKVSATKFSAGSTIYLARSCSWDGGMSLNGTGSAAKPIVLDAYGSGAAPMVANSTGAQYSFAIALNGEYQVVQNLLIEDGSEAGVSLTQPHETVNANEITASGNGVEVSSTATNALMEHNNVHDLKMALNKPDDVNDYGAVGFNLGANDAEVAYNTCTNCEAPSAEYGTDGGFVEIYNNGDNDNIHDNFAQNDDGFLEVGGGSGATSANNILVDYNVMVDTGDAANLHSSDSFSLPVTLKFQNNTFYDPSTTDVVFNAPASELTSVQNNIFYVGHAIYSEAQTHTNNIYYMLDNAQIGYSLAATEKTVNPLFVSSTTGNFQLQSSSPARAAGIDLGFTKDYVGKAVPSPPDIGAYQY